MDLLQSRIQTFRDSNENSNSDPTYLVLCNLYLGAERFPVEEEDLEIENCVENFLRNQEGHDHRWFNASLSSEILKKHDSELDLKISKVQSSERLQSVLRLSASMTSSYFNIMQWIELTSNVLKSTSENFDHRCEAVAGLCILNGFLEYYLDLMAFISLENGKSDEDPEIDFEDHIQIGKLCAKVSDLALEDPDVKFTLDVALGTSLSILKDFENWFGDSELV
jgi:hypothetical protein